jgi:Fe-S cluster assembly protein SufB
VELCPNAFNSRSYSQCDSLLIGNTSQANTFPYIQVQNPNVKIEHEATTSKIGEEQLFYFLQRNIDIENAVALMISGFCKEIFNNLPLEFATEADKLLSLKLEGTVG